ncbi:hypothetical protein C8R46DRAFT_1243938 [Mycena filopes]|nr:hypothetical protein C8R46DRAFT_1243938 [Mycena filopes]
MLSLAARTAAAHPRPPSPYIRDNSETASSVASKVIPTTDGPVTLHFQDFTRVAGETLHGHVELNFALAQADNLEHLRIAFKGTIHSEIDNDNSDKTTTTQTVTLFHTERSLWSPGSASPSPGSHTLTCPFEFTLPQTLPPSFHCSGYDRKATIGYSLEVVGERTGFYRWNRRIRKLISVVPSASQGQLLAKEILSQGPWSGSWRDFTRDRKLRQGILGHYSRARLTLPDIPSFPIATAIPFTFYAETETKTMHGSDAPVDKHGKQLFPAPPALPSDVRLTLHRMVNIRARRDKDHLETDFPLKGSLGDASQSATVHQAIEEPEWIPGAGEKATGGRGVWRRAIRFESAISIPFAPTCSTELVDWRYSLRFTVPFPGLGNDLQLDVPVDLDPGWACPPSPTMGAGSLSLSYADVLPAGPPPPMLDLPPAYWAGVDQPWDKDDKS